MSPGTPGCFLKAYEEVNGKRLYYKLSNYDSYRGVFGHECVNEIDCKSSNGYFEEFPM